MLGNLRRGSSFEYTSKLQRMFVDKALSRELHTGYMRVRSRPVGLLRGYYCITRICGGDKCKCKDPTMMI